MTALTENLEFLKHLLPALIYCAICGGIVGFERGRKGHAAGMKTQIFICTGAAIFTMCSLALIAKQGGGDAGRIIAQIASGVGFLGAGTIMAKDRIIGLTTAAIIWVMAALGIMIGMGFGPAALVVSGGMIVSIEIVSAIEKRFVQTHIVERRQSPQLSLIPQKEEDESERKIG